MYITTDSVWLVLDSSSFGGIETHVLQLASGIKPHVNVRVVFVQGDAPPELKARLQEKNIPFSMCEKGFFSFLALAYQGKPSVIHTHGYKAGIYGRVVAKMTGVKLVSTFHAGEHLTGKLWCYDWCDRYSSLVNDHVYCVSRKIRKKLPGASERIENFVDTTNIDTTHGHHIAFVGRLSREKGPDLYCDLAKNFRDREFYVYGDGPMAKDLKCSAPKNVRFIGAVKNMDAEWKKIGVLIICSRYEGLPMVAIEAMSRGIPVIAFDVGDLSNLIEDQVNGWLVKKNCMSGLAGALYEWSEIDSVEKQSIARSARKRIEAKWSSDVVIPRYLKTYQSICSRA